MRASAFFLRSLGPITKVVIAAVEAINAKSATFIMRSTPKRVFMSI